MKTLKIIGSVILTIVLIPTVWIIAGYAVKKVFSDSYGDLWLQFGFSLIVILVLLLIVLICYGIYYFVFDGE